jgi:hypothetical protein
MTYKSQRIILVIFSKVKDFPHLHPFSSRPSCLAPTPSQNQDQFMYQKITLPNNQVMTDCAMSSLASLQASAAAGVWYNLLGHLVQR